MILLFLSVILISLSSVSAVDLDNSSSIILGDTYNDVSSSNIELEDNNIDVSHDTNDNNINTFDNNEFDDNLELSDVQSEHRKTLSVSNNNKDVLNADGDYVQ